jgi:hypothetical protein
MMLFFFKMITVTALLALAPSCVAVWGAGHQVVSSNSEGMLIQYDPLIASPKELAQIAENEAGKHGKVIVPGEHERAHYSGIHQRYFRFVRPQ